MAVYSNNVQILLNRIDDLQAQIEAMKPISKEQVNKIFQKYRLDWNYNSNSIEGNSLNYGETVAFIMEGLTAKGKPLKDHLDIKGHNEAIDFLVDMQEKESELTERDIRSLHQMILVEPYKSEAQTADGQKTTKVINLGVYKSSPNHVVTATGQTHYYATPEETPAMMQELMHWYRDNRLKMHPLVLSTLFHHRFVSIHPFDDGNGRMSRLLSNLILMQAGLPPVVVRKDQRSEYYGVLSQADAGVVDPLLEYFAGLLIRSLEIYLKGARGEDISDPSDLDKEIALFIAGFDEEELSKVPISQEIIPELQNALFLPLFNNIMLYGRKIGKLFFEVYAQANMFSYNLENNTSKDYSPTGIISLDDFYKTLIEDEGLVRTLAMKQNRHNSQDDNIRMAFRLHFKGLKAKEEVKEIVGLVIIDFGWASYNIQYDGYDILLKKAYPKAISKSENQAIADNFFRNIMNSITKAIKGEDD